MLRKVGCVMIVRHFLNWARSAPASERAEATRALARAFLISDLSSDDRIAAEGALLMLLDDASPLVRRAMADVFAASWDAPAAIVHALSCDQPSVASPIIAHSPLLIDADLVDLVATANIEIQTLIAQREQLPRTVSAALAEVAAAQACLDLLENPSADIADMSMARIAERFGHLAAIREALLLRDDLPSAIRLALIEKLSETLSAFVVGRNWLTQDRAVRINFESCEKARVNIAARTEGAGLPALVSHLAESGTLTPGLILRALLSGNLLMFEHALVELTGVAPHRVAGLIQDCSGAALSSLLHKAGLPPATIPAFREAVLAYHEVGFVDSAGGQSRLRRTMVERVLTRLAGQDARETDPLMILLRRFAAEAAREEARLFCDELVATPDVPEFVDDSYADFEDADYDEALIAA
jgi:uncharacterized protein (DUF2336 family)